MSLDRLLGPVAPHGFSLKKAWGETIRATRDRKRRTGEKGMLGSLAEVERVRSRPLRSGFDEGDLSRLKALLGRVLQTPTGSAERDQALGSLELELVGVLQGVYSGRLRVELHGWPRLLGASDRARLLTPCGPDLSSVEAGDVALLRHRLDGLVLGGSRLEVRPCLPADTVLPAVPRRQRNRSIRGRGGLWLETVDDESRFSLTPEPIARAQAELFTAPVVLDLFGGVGGNSIALAQAGHRVVMVEPDDQRLAAARRSLSIHGLADSVECVPGALESHLSDLLAVYPEAGVFLDPPWGGRDWSRNGQGWSELLGAFSCLDEVIDSAAEVVLKLPRSFDLETLPHRSAAWQARLDWGDSGAVPKMLTAWSLPWSDARE